MVPVASRPGSPAGHRSRGGPVSAALRGVPWVAAVVGLGVPALATLLRGLPGDLLTVTAGLAPGADGRWVLLAAVAALGVTLVTGAGAVPGAVPAEVPLVRARASSCAAAAVPPPAFDPDAAGRVRPRAPGRGAISR